MHFVEKVNRYLEKGTEESWALLYENMYEPANQEIIENNNQLFLLQSMAYIWKMENRVMDNTVIFAHISTVEEAVERYQLIKFVARRIEQLMPEGVCVEGMQELMDMQISVSALVYVIKKEVRKSYHTMLLAAGFLEKCGHTEQRDELLRFVAKLKFEEYEKETLQTECETQRESTLYQKERIKNQFSFVVCTNNQLFWRECLLYLSQLYVPEGWEVNVLAIEEARSMTAGYNEGMRVGGSGYKIYIHQDVFIRNRWFLYDILHIFQSDKAIGLIGVVGSVRLPKDGVMWHGERVGEIYSASNVDTGLVMNHLEPVKELYREVEALDGMLLVTREDIPFREDLFDGWDFYDISACMEFGKRGYKVVVAGQQEPWCIHDCGKADLKCYEHYRKIFLQEYTEKNIESR